MQITFDPVKRKKNLIDKVLDFVDAVEVFEGVTVTTTDSRRQYGEVRFITVGRLEGRVVVIVWTPRGGTRRVISMRKANEREIREFTHAGN